jgi:dynein heavy chain
LDGAEEKKEKIKKAREEYIPCGLRSAVLFFVLNDMVSIDVMYQFSLEAYITLFKSSIERYAEKNPMATGEERIDLLNQYHQRAVYRYACRGLFERHKLLFSLQLCLKTMMSENRVPAHEFAFFCYGGVVVDRSDQRPNPCADWIDAPTWDNIVVLDSVPGFMGLASAFEQGHRDWKVWFTASKPESTPLPGDWDNKCTELQRVCVLRALRLDRVLFAASGFVSSNLGPQFADPPAFDLRKVFDTSSKYTPLIFILSPGVDPTQQVLGLAKNLDDKKVENVALGQGQAPVRSASSTRGCARATGRSSPTATSCSRGCPSSRRSSRRTARRPRARPTRPCRTPSSACGCRRRRRMSSPSPSCSAASR